ncbi:unnamed protein product [Miscanthus lutarioriparius]|uniref:Protein kinase domain-containing protein n=1 Tax=Miscanthus lutarioriparius TaxID=422564 RepID=A0A811NQA0_9POAL|nr:unnamed protein product [Miscanthus lutarioriparius]
MLLLQLRLLLSATATNSATASSPSQPSHNGDEGALLAFKAKMSGHSGVLDSWNKSTSYCSWEGVTCGRRHRWRVVGLNLSSQGLAGTISPAIGNLTFLRLLDLSYNSLQGEIPGSQPASAPSGGSEAFTWFKTRSLVSSRVTSAAASASLHGRLPTDLGKRLPSIQQLGIGDNRFTGALPPSLTNFSRLQKLYAEVNSFIGIVPSGLGRLQNLEVFALSDNILEANNEEEWQFIGSLVNCSRLQGLGFGWNRFVGKLPGPLVNLSINLQWLQIANNNISGVIPSDIGNLAGLEMLDFGKNLLTGVIPESIGKLTRLQLLALDSNYLSGHLPSSIGNLSSLLQLYAGNNSLEGPIPPSIGNLSKLLALDLSNSNLTGLIPNEIMELPSISWVLDLSNNMLEGPLPLEVGSLVHLEQLFLSGNKLSGEIPDTIGNCRVMEILSMDGNSFQGSIPATFKNMAGLTVLNLTDNKQDGSIPGNLATLTNLQELYFGHNNLSATIPELLVYSTSLLRLDLSYNNLQGEVPKGGVFKNLTGLSIVGNNALCGWIPQLHLSKCPSSCARKNRKGTPKFLRIAIPAIGSLILLFLVWAGFHYRKSKIAPKKDLPPQFAEVELPIVPYNDILKGTDGFSEANVLGKGRYGTVYKGTLENQAIVVAVKVFNVQQS